MLPRGPWFMGAWMAAGALLDVACRYAFYAAVRVVLPLGLPGVSSLRVREAVGMAIGLMIIWTVHAAIMPCLAAGIFGWRPTCRLLALGVGFLLAGTAAVLLGNHLGLALLGAMLFSDFLSDATASTLIEFPFVLTVRWERVIA